jgi:hypothetical protein
MVQHPSYPGPILLQDSTDSCGTQRNFAISNLKYLKICKSNGKNACAFCQLKHVARNQEIHSTLSICSFNFFSVFNTEEHFESDLLTIERPWQKPKNTHSTTSNWVCLKTVYPYTQWLMIIIPTKWL